MPPATSLQPALRRGLLSDLQHPSQVFANLTPNWFASVMGTGVLTVAAATLPVHVVGLRIAAIVVWLLTAALLILLLAGTAAHWRRHPAVARGHVHDPVMGHFYGAPPMALLTVGTGALLVGRDVLGVSLAVDLDWILWWAGTVTGLASAVVVPYLMLTRRRLQSADAFGGWLMPVVPPMVSASAGALLVPHTPAGSREVLLVSCYVMFGLALLASVPIIVLVCRRLLAHGPGEARLVPTLWIVLGPLGQSVTAVNLLATASIGVVSDHRAEWLDTFAIGYGVVVLSAAGVFALIAASATARAMRDGLPFSLTWWSFTFPVGTCVTGATGMAVHTGADAYRVIAVAGYVGLVLAWLVVANRTGRGAWRGHLFLAPARAPRLADAVS